MVNYKIKLCEYFDSLIHRLDLAVETAIIDNRHDEDLINELNKQRDAFLNEIRRVQAYNLRALSDLNTKPGEELSYDELFAKFCFFIKVFNDQDRLAHSYDDLAGVEINLRLIVTDKYLTEAQIKCYEAVYNFCHNSRRAYLRYHLIFQDCNKYVSCIS
jgi:hypothetical protein